ncbi:MAG: DUF6232 family protein [Hyphomicrobiaceae bacterium]
MLDFLRAGKAPAKGEAFGQLTIDKRVLVTPKSTISIPNIAVISSGTMPVANRLVWGLVLALVVGTVAAFSIGDAHTSQPIAAAGAIMAAAALILAVFFSRTRKPTLVISSSDGRATLFTGQPDTLDEVRRLLTDKINTDDDTAVYRVNLEKGAIQSINAAHAGSIGSAGPGFGGQVAAAGNNRLDTADPFAQAASAPGAQLGNGHAASGNSFHVDYSLILPQIVEMQRFYAQRQDTRDIAERLSELEHLMRAGTPTVGSRSRLSQLIGDLSSMLGAYPGVVQIFQQAARMAGF